MGTKPQTIVTCFFYYNRMVFILDGTYRMVGVCGLGRRLKHRGRRSGDMGASNYSLHTNSQKYISCFPLCHCMKYTLSIGLSVG